MFQFQLSAANTIGIPAGQPQSFRHVRLLDRAAIFGYKEANDFEDCPRTGRPSREGGGRCEEPTRELHTTVDRKGIE
jgi:hypothetical protein